MPAAPSLLIVPYRSKTGKLYSQIPTSGAGDFTVTRDTTATRFDSAGLIASVASGIPRLDYYTSGGTVGCPALLVEPSSTNFARFVNQMTTQDIPAASGGMTTTTGSTDFLAPDGTSGSITKYVGGAASGSNQYAYYTGGNIVASASGVHTYSLFIKRGAINPLNFCAINFALFNAASGTATSYFNLASGTAITAGASIQDYGNGWYRIISAPYTLAATDLSGQIVFNMASTSGSLSFAASGALNLTAYTWGAQLEAGSVATSYIPTTTGSVTRNADVISVTGAVSGSIGQASGTIYAEVDIRNAFAGTFISLDIGSGADFLIIGRTSGLAVIVQLRRSNGSVVTIITSSAVALGVHKIALGYTNGDYALYIDGVSAGTSTNSTDYPSAALTRCGLAVTSYNIFNDRIRAAALYTTRLTNAELATLTTP